ncbi:MAG: uracil-DNA glycosylase [Anaerolineae bacterium]|jgi:uracil-DNA glycosylase family 4|nr:MAG: uracil-DNA glycosylase [Anaerolineae bacterium]
MSLETWKELEEEILACRKCERLVAWREQVAATKRKAFREQLYWGKPVLGFGDYQAEMLIVGLAPGAHGANRTGRMFTGDSSGDFLYRALYKAGFSNQPNASHRDDGLQLRNVYISAVCRCVPPLNKPTPSEVRNCIPYLHREIALLHNLRVVVALGRIAFEQVVTYFGLSPKPAFQHGGCYRGGLPAITILASYHPSRQNTQTGRLTEQMFDQIWAQAKSFLVRSIH